MEIKASTSSCLALSCRISDLELKSERRAYDKDDRLVTTMIVFISNGSWYIFEY
jgi:hypothetical protein